MAHKEQYKNCHGVMMERYAKAPTAPKKSGPPTCTCYICKEQVLKSTTKGTMKGRACSSHSGVEVDNIIFQAIKRTGLDSKEADKCWVCGQKKETKIFEAPDDQDFRFIKVRPPYHRAVGLLDHVLACSGCAANMKL